MINIKDILTIALKERSIFHSEADFQHHLAWKIHKEFEDVELRLEYPLSKNNSNRWEYCDILLRLPCNIGIELKYKTKFMNIDIDGEQFELKNQSAQDVGRYDFLKDVSRLENWSERGQIGSGCAIFLTNDHTYWTHPRYANTVDKDFRIHESKIVSGELAWGKKASAGTMKSRENPITLRNKYSLKWDDVPRSNFKYLLLLVNSANKSMQPTTRASAD